MDETKALQLLKENLSKYDEERRNGKDEVIKLVITASTVLLSFIAITTSKSADCAVLIKASMTFLLATLGLCFYKFYYHNVGIPNEVIDQLNTALQASSSASEALGKVESININSDLIVRWSMRLIFLSFAAAITSLVIRLYIVI